MTNSDAQQQLDQCEAELDEIQKIIDELKQTHSIAPYLTNYAIIKCCGTIEIGFKSIIFDFHGSAHLQAKNYIEKVFYDSSMNPSLSNIRNTLKKFDDNWYSDFETELDLLADREKVLLSLSSLNTERNKIAHGKNTSIGLAQVRVYFLDSRKIIEIIDSIIK